MGGAGRWPPDTPRGPSSWTWLGLGAYALAGHPCSPWPLAPLPRGLSRSPRSWQLHAVGSARVEEGSRNSTSSWTLPAPAQGPPRPGEGSAQPAPHQARPLPHCSGRSVVPTKGEGAICPPQLAAKAFSFCTVSPTEIPRGALEDSTEVTTTHTFSQHQKRLPQRPRGPTVQGRNH